MLRLENVSYVVEENGVKVRFDSMATYPIMEGTRCRGVVVESESENKN